MCTRSHCGLRSASMLSWLQLILWSHWRPRPGGPDVDGCGDWAEVHLLILSLKMSGPLWQLSDIWTAFRNVSECRGCCFRPGPFQMHFPMCYLKPLKCAAHTLRFLTPLRDLLHSLKQGILIEWLWMLTHKGRISIWRMFVMMIIWKPLAYKNILKTCHIVPFIGS